MKTKVHDSPCTAAAAAVADGCFSQLLLLLAAVAGCFCQLLDNDGACVGVSVNPDKCKTIIFLSLYL